jgi:pectate lyase
MKIHEVFYPDDAITIDACQHVWVDHNELYSKIGTGITVDTYDGLLDIKNGSCYVTVSWNHLHHHMKCSLIGHTDDISQQTLDSQMRITYHHNWFSYTDGRNPSIRFGAIHMFNNYFEEITDYGIAARDGAHAKIENCHYNNVVLPMSTDKFPVDGLPNGYICESGNIFTGTCGANVISQTGCDFWDSVTLPYSYTLDSVEAVESTVKLFAGVEGTTSVVESTPEIPRSFGLQQNYPNPFNPTTNMQFSVPQDGYASLKVYNMLGQEVATLFSGIAKAGHYIPVTFNASRLASGIYFARLQYNGKSLVQRMLMTK